MITMTESEPRPHAPAPPDVDYSLPGPWTRLETDATRKASFARSFAINVPLRLIHTQQESDGGSLAARLLRAPRAECEEDAANLRDRKEAKAVGTFLSLLSDTSIESLPANKRPRGGSFGGNARLDAHCRTCYRWWDGATTRYQSSYMWCVEAVFAPTEEGEPPRLAGLRLWKHIIDPFFSDSLSLDAQRQLTAELHAKASQTGGAGQKRARAALSDSNFLPSKAHLRINSLYKLMEAYRSMGTTSSPLVPDWKRHCARIQPGYDLFATPLATRPADRHVHALAPELLLNPRMNRHALTAGYEDEDVVKEQLKRSNYSASPFQMPSLVTKNRMVWMLSSGNSPLYARLPSELSVMLDKSLCCDAPA